MSAENFSPRVRFYPVFVEPTPAPHSPIQNGRSSRPPTKSLLKAPRYKACNVRMQQQLESSQDASTMSMDLDISNHSESKTIELFSDVYKSLGCTHDVTEDCAGANARDVRAASLCHGCGDGDFGNDAGDIDGDDKRGDLGETMEGESIPKKMHEVEEVQLEKMQDTNVPSKSQARINKIDAVIENHQKQKESNWGKSQARGRTMRRNGENSTNASAEDMSPTPSSNCNNDRREHAQAQEQPRAGENEDFQSRQKESSGDTPRGRSTTPQRGNKKGHDRAAGRGSERALSPSSLSKSGDFPDAAQASGRESHHQPGQGQSRRKGEGVSRSFSSSSNLAHQKPQARFNLEEFTTCVVIAGEDARNQDQQQPLPLSQSGKKPGGASTPASSSPNPVGQSQDQVQPELMKWTSTHCRAGNYNGYPLPPLSIQGEPHEIEEMQLVKMKEGKVPSKSQATMNKIDAVGKNHQKQKERSGEKSQAGGSPRRRRSKDPANHDAEAGELPSLSKKTIYPPLAYSSKFSTSRRRHAQMQEQSQVEKNEKVQNPQKKSSSGVPHGRSPTPHRGNQKGQDRAAGKGDERAFLSSSLSKRGDFPDAAQASGGVSRPFSSSSNVADQKHPARFNLEEFTTGAVMASEDARDQDQQQPLPPRQSGQNPGRASTPTVSFLNSAGHSQDRVQSDLMKWISTHCRAGGYNGCPLPPRHQQPETHRTFGNSFDEPQAGFVPGEYPLQSLGRHEGIHRSIPSPSSAGNKHHYESLSLPEQSGQQRINSSVVSPTRRHDPPLSAMAQKKGMTRSVRSTASSQCAAASVSKCDESDHQNHHQPAQTQAAAMTRPVQSLISSQHDTDRTAAAADRNDEVANSNDDLSTLTHKSPFPKISGADQRVYEYDAKGRCIHHPHVQMRKKKLLGRGWKVIMSACPDCCVEELRRIQFAEEENMRKEAREKREKEGKQRTQKKKSSPRKGRNKEARDGKHESGGKQVGRDKGRHNSSRGNNKHLQSSIRNTTGHNKSDTPKIEKPAPRAPTPPPRRWASLKSRDMTESFANTNAAQSTKRSLSHGLQQSLDKTKRAGQQRSDETVSLTESSLSNETLCDVSDSNGNRKQSRSRISKRDSRQSLTPAPPRRPSRSRSGRRPHNDFATRLTAAIDSSSAVKHSSLGASHRDVDDSHGNFHRPQSSLNRAASTSKKHKPKSPVTPPPPPRSSRRVKSQENLREASVASSIDTLVYDKGLERSSSVKGSPCKSSIENIEDGKQTYQHQNSSVTMNSTAVAVAPPRKSYPQGSSEDISTLAILNTYQHLCDEVALLSESLQILSEEGIGNNSQIHHRRQRQGSFDSINSNGGCSTTNETFIPSPPPQRRIAIPQDSGPHDETTSLNRSSHSLGDHQIDGNGSHQHGSSPSRNSSSNITVDSIIVSPAPPSRRSQSPGPRRSHIFRHFRVAGGRMNAVNAQYNDTKGRSGIYNGGVNDHFVPHGKGTMEYDSGVLKEGEWKNGRFQETKIKESRKSNN